jgi:hypothetical protein
LNTYANEMQKAITRMDTTRVLTILGLAKLSGVALAVPVDHATGPTHKLTVQQNRRRR